MQKLDQDAADLWDEYSSARDSARKADSTKRKADGRKKDAEELLLAAMGESSRAELPDGRVIFFVTKEQHRRAQPAKDVSWREWHEEE